MDRALDLSNGDTKYLVGRAAAALAAGSTCGLWRAMSADSFEVTGQTDDAIRFHERALERQLQLGNGTLRTTLLQVISCPTPSGAK